MTRILVIHGPNLNLLGTRQPEIYGTTTLEEIDASLRVRAAVARIEIDTMQSNSEGEIVSRIQAARGRYDGLLINPAAYSHTSVAILDALQAVALPAVEVHLSNIHRREAFRRRSVTAAGCLGVVMGFGARSYLIALDGILGHLGHPPAPGRDSRRRRPASPLRRSPGRRKALPHGTNKERGPT